MRNCNRSATYQGDIESTQELFTRHSNFRALFDVIGNAVITAQHYRTCESHEFLRSLVERAVLISLRIKREKPFDAEVAATEQLLVHLGAITIKVVHSQVLSIYVSSSAVGCLATLSQALASQNWG